MTSVAPGGLPSLPGDKLPRGRHKLSRDAVLSSQRERIVEAMLECVAAKGYAATTVADVVSAARVSRNAFYELYADKAACFLECCDELLNILLDELNAQAPLQPTWRDSLSAGMTMYLQSWQARPSFATAYLLEHSAVGPGAAEQRAHAYQRFRDLFAGLAARARIEAPWLPPLRPLATRLLVVAVTELVAEEVRAGRLDRLDDLHDDLVDLAELILTG